MIFRELIRCGDGHDRVWTEHVPQVERLDASPDRRLRFRDLGPDRIGREVRGQNILALSVIFEEGDAPDQLQGVRSVGEAQGLVHGGTERLKMAESLCQSVEMGDRLSLPYDALGRQGQVVGGVVGQFHIAPHMLMPLMEGASRR